MRTTMIMALIGATALVAGCTSSTGGGSSSTRSNPSGLASSSAPPSSSPSPSPSASASATSSAPAAPSSSASARAVGPAGGPVPRGFTPTSVTFISSATGWVLGTAPCTTKPCTSILRTRDGGESWRGIPAPKASLGRPEDVGSTGGVAVLRFADASDGWAGVGQLWSTHDGGATWHRQSIGASGSRVASIETGGGYVYATTDSCPGSATCTQSAHVYVSAIGRDSWREVASPAGQVNPAGLVVQGGDWYLSTTAGVYRGSGTGAATRLANPCPAEGQFRTSARVAVADRSHLDALCNSEGAGGSAAYQLYGTTDGGTHWSKAGGSRREDSGLFGLADNAKGVLLIAVASGGSDILRTTDDGATLHRASVSTAPGGIEWADLGFTSSTQAVVVLMSTALYLSHDSGRTFEKVGF